MNDMSGNQNPVDRQLKGLTNLLLSQARARSAKSIDELGFILVNDSRLLVPYQSAIVWLKKPGQSYRQGRILSASDVPEIDNKAPFSIWIDSISRLLVKAGQTESVCISRKALLEKDTSSFLKILPSADLLEQWTNYAPDFLLWLPLEYSGGQHAGGFLLLRDTPWQEAEQRIMEHWRESASHALSALESRPRLHWYQKLSQIKRWGLVGVSVLLLLVMMIPVKLSVLAPAEVAPVDPHIVRTPLNGTIKQVAIKPNQLVNAGDLLISLDDTSLQTRLEIAQQSLVIAEAEYHQAQQASFRDINAKSTLALLKLKIEKQKAEVAYVETLLKRSDITAKKSGVAIFSTATKLLGRSVQLGERLLTIANPKQAELEIWLPVGDDIRLEKGSEVRLFPSVSPEKYIRASLSDMGYQAEVQSDGLAYRLSASFLDTSEVPRIGQRGVARLEGEQVSLFYYLFRRPAAFFRQMFGI